MKSLISTVALIGSLLALGCGSGEELPEIDCATAMVPKYSEMTAFRKCTECHSSQLTTAAARHDAEMGYDFDTYAGATDHATKIVEEVYEGKMPPADEPQLTEDEKQQLYAWGLCGTPE